MESSTAQQHPQTPIMTDVDEQSMAPAPPPPTHGWFVELRGHITLSSITDWFYMTHHFRQGILHTSETSWLIDYPDKERCERAMEYAKSCSCYGGWLRPSRTGIPRITSCILHLELSSITTIPEPLEPSSLQRPTPAPAPAPTRTPAPSVTIPPPVHVEVPFRRGVPLMGMRLEWFVQEMLVTEESVMRDIERRSTGKYQLHMAATAA